MLLIDEFFYPFLKDNKVVFGIYLLFIMFTYPFKTIILPKLYSVLFNNINARTNPSNKHFTFDIMNQILAVTTPGVILRIISVWVIMQFAEIGKTWSESIFIPNFLTFVRNKIFKRTIIRHSSDYEDLQTGKHITRIMELSRYLKYILNWGVSEIIPSVIAIVMTTMYFMYIDSTIFKLLWFNLIIITSLYFVFGVYLIDIAMERELEYFKLNESMNDSMNNLMNIYLNNTENVEFNKNEMINTSFGGIYAEHKIREGRLVFVSTVLTNTTYGLSMIYLYNMFTTKKMNATSLVSAFLLLGNYNTYVTGCIRNIVDACFSYCGMIKASMPFLEDIFERGSERTVESGITNGKIEFKNITYSYKDQDGLLFDKFNLSISAGEKVSIVGPSGSGKSSLMKLLVSIYKPASGEILVDNNNIATMSHKYIRDNIIYVNQRTTLFDMNIVDNIAYGNEHIDKRTIEQLLDRYRLNTAFSELEKGIYSEAGVNGSNLSGGMQKIVIILRGILKDGKIFVFDEPLAGLDAVSREKVIKLIMDLTKGKTLIVITHDLEIVPVMNRVIKLDAHKQ